jgi:hypothetical protein
MLTRHHDANFSLFALAYFQCSESAGGYAALALADGLRTHYDITPIKVFAAAPPFKLRSETVFKFIRELDENLAHPTFAIAFSVAHVTMAYSKTRPGLANYLEGASTLREERAQSFVEMFTDPTPVTPILFLSTYVEYVVANYPNNFADLATLNPAVVAFYQDAIENNDPDPCINNSDLESFGMVEFCEALNDNDLSEALEAVDYPLETCISNEDEVVSIDNIPPDFLTYTVTGVHFTTPSYCFPLFLGGSDIEKPKVNIPKSPKSPKAPKAPKQGGSKKSPKAPKAKKNKKNKKKERSV